TCQSDRGPLERQAPSVCLAEWASKQATSSSSGTLPRSSLTRYLAPTPSYPVAQSGDSLPSLQLCCNYHSCPTSVRQWCCTGCCQQLRRCSEQKTSRLD